MRYLNVWLAAAGCAVVAAACADPGGNMPAPATATAFDSAYVSVFDAGRNRTLPLKVYFPANSTGRDYPVVLFSHGGSGSEQSNEAYRYFGSYLASNGYVCIHPTQVQTGAPLVVDKPLDLTFLLDQIDAGSLAVPRFAGRLDASRVAAAGHSFGGYATVALAGAKLNEAAPSAAFRDARLRAFVVLSPSGQGQFGLYRNAADNSWNDIRKPVYCFVGGNETDKDGAGSPEEPGWRLQAYELMPAGDKYQSVIPGAEHYHFNDRGSQGTGEAAEAYTQQFVQRTARRFLDYYLLGMGTPADIQLADPLPGVVNSRK